MSDDEKQNPFTDTPDRTCLLITLPQEKIDLPTDPYHIRQYY